MTKTPYNNKNEAPTPNVWFKTQMDDAGELEVSAYVPVNGAVSRKDIIIVGVGVPDDIHISPEEAGLSPQTIDRIKLEAVANRVDQQNEKTKSKGGH
jgi:hypothetical protein